MECHICEVRSSVGYCVECHELLCETCGIPCDQCGKMSCPTHIHETKSGKALCVGCYAERRAKKEAVKAEVVHRHTKEHRDAVNTSFQTLEAQPGAEGEEISNEALVASARRIVEPWKMSLYISLAGIGLGLLLLLFPSLRHVASPIGAKSFATGMLLFVFILFSVFWSWVGLRNEEYYRDRVKCFFGIGGCVVCVILAFITISSAPVVEARPILKSVPQRTGGEDQQQLQEWRDKALQKYQR